MLNTAHALKIANMETRLKIKPFKMSSFKVTLYIEPSYILVKLKMVSRDPLTGNSDDNEWDACDYSFYLKECSVLESNIDRLLITFDSACFRSAK